MTALSSPWSSSVASGATVSVLSGASSSSAGSAFGYVAGVAGVAGSVGLVLGGGGGGGGPVLSDSWGPSSKPPRSSSYNTWVMSFNLFTKSILVLFFSYILN